MFRHFVFACVKTAVNVYTSAPGPNITPEPAPAWAAAGGVSASAADSNRMAIRPPARSAESRPRDFVFAYICGPPIKLVWYSAAR
ncbi:MAG: hypothetical protein BWY52_02687 [Chloroflexi bacterium ADurb.Bin325]|nr:MAG: hypothetical protein BWY52_02687 [Chloroflexi bacterium ADurb.Bin325]